MSNYRIIHRHQDLGLRISSLYRQQQLAVGILDLGSEEDLVSSLDWYMGNMNIALHVMTTQSRIDEFPVLDKYPDVTFIIFKNPATTGEYINAFADECYSTFFLVVRTDSELIAFEGDRLITAMSDRNHPAIITPVMISATGEIMPTLRAPFIRGKQVEPLSFVPDLEAPEQDNLYPVMELGLYDRALFQRLRGFDPQINGEYFQAMDYGVRCFLLGYRAVTMKELAIRFPGRVSIVEDRSECEGVERFYTKALSIRRIAGKNVVEKWKPYVDKELLNDEIKKKQLILQKTDFFTLISTWSVRDK
ncbi:MAG: hypothetical protein SPJ34_02420 [Candidatus Ornithospirochaeta sp.]|nr:hypothetical protein [Candidatus Ornithospirochaeta sp.]